MKTISTVFTLVILVSLSGCGRDVPPLGQVQGVVTLDGRPLAGAVVIFEPKAEGRSSRAVTDAKGHYRLVYLRDISGALLGTHTVRIFTATEKYPQERLSKKYNKESTLTAEVAAGANECDFVLKSK
jgi:hypothetical protein